MAGPHAPNDLIIVRAHNGGDYKVSSFSAPQPSCLVSIEQGLKGSPPWLAFEFDRLIPSNILDSAEFKKLLSVLSGQIEFDIRNRRRLRVSFTGKPEIAMRQVVSLIFRHIR